MNFHVCMVKINQIRAPFATKWGTLRDALVSKIGSLGKDLAGEHPLRQCEPVTGSRKHERPGTILMDYELDPGSLAVQNHMENLMVSADS